MIKLYAGNILSLKVYDFCLSEEFRKVFLLSVLRITSDKLIFFLQIIVNILIAFKNTIRMSAERIRLSAGGLIVSAE